MATSINDFIQHFQGGGLRQHLFEVEGEIGRDEFGGNSSLPFLIQSASLPASTLGTIPIPYRGRQIKIPGDRTFAEWTITVIASTDMRIRNSFEAWSNDINSYEGNTLFGPDFGSAGPFGAIFKDWRVYQLNRQGEKIKGYEMIGCWPSDIGAITVDATSTDTIETFDVTLQYSYFLTDSTTDGEVGLVVSDQIKGRNTITDNS